MDGITAGTEWRFTFLHKMGKDPIRNTYMEGYIMPKQNIKQAESTTFIMDFDLFTDFCGHFFCCDTTEGYEDCANINNGYNCSHPEQEEVEEDELTGKEVGCCHAFSCPLCYPASNRNVSEQYPNIVPAGAAPEGTFHGDTDLVVLPCPENFGLKDHNR